MSAPILRSELTDQNKIEPLAGGAVYLSILQRPLMQNVLPLCASIALHAAIIIAGIATYHAIHRMAVLHHEQIVVPEMAIADGSLPNSALTEAENSGRVEQDKIFGAQDPNGMASVRSRNLSTALAGGAPGIGDGSADVSIGYKATLSGGRNGQGASGFGDVGDGAGGALMPFGMHRKISGSSREASIFRDSNQFKKIVYVLDATGSMASAFDALRRQARMAVMNLQPPQSFNIIFINDHNLPPLAPTLLFVTPAAKQRAVEFIDSTAPRGGTDPLPALEKAFALQPQVIHFLIDPSDFPDKQAVLNLVTAKAGVAHVRLNVIGFEGHDPENEAFLKAIANQTGGSYRFVSEKDLENQ